MKQELVTKILTNALNEATKKQVAISISIVDNGGHLKGFLRMDNCSFAAIDVSRKKAVSACAFGMPTNLIGEIVQTNPFMKEAFNSHSDIFYFGGGLPIMLDNKIIGGIGISGVDPNQDMEIAQTALTDLK